MGASPMTKQMVETENLPIGSIVHVDHLHESEWPCIRKSDSSQVEPSVVKVIAKRRPAVLVGFTTLVSQESLKFSRVFVRRREGCEEETVVEYAGACRQAVLLLLIQGNPPKFAATARDATGIEIRRWVNFDMRRHACWGKPSVVDVVPRAYETRFVEPSSAMKTKIVSQLTLKHFYDLAIRIKPFCDNTSRKWWIDELDQPSEPSSLLPTPH